MDSLLPLNATTFERDVEAALSHIRKDVDGVTPVGVTSIDVTPASDLWNPETCPEDLLPWLAWAEGVDEWSTVWSVSVQRSVIKAQRLIRRRRGTKAAVVAAVEALSGAATIKEWFQYTPPRTPHTFDIVIAGGDGYIESELQQSMIRAIDRNKPVRSHYTLGVGLTSAGSLNLVGTAMVATYKRMEFTA